MKEKKIQHRRIRGWRSQMSFFNFCEEPLASSFKDYEDPKALPSLPRVSSEDPAKIPQL
jgi:hypothetical protein